jgi:glycosyltransferase involved in cell wall biosynthesis
MAKLRIYANYKTIDGPWGGANNFMRALERHWSASGHVEYAANIDDVYDILFLNSVGTGPGREDPRKLVISKREIQRLKARGRAAYWAAVMHRQTPKKIVFRSINLEQWADSRSWLTRRDRQVIGAMNISDHVIFQTAYMAPVFRAAGYYGHSYSVIHNGADPHFFHARGRSYWRGSTPLKVLSCSFATRASKRFDVIAALSALPGIECTHVGNWPHSVANGTVRLVGVQQRDKIADLMRSSDIFVHSAIRDACPNVVQEALACGLPVLYSRDSGSAELAADYGVALDKGFRHALDEIRGRYSEFVDRIKTEHYRFTVERAAAQYLSVFEMLASNNDVPNGARVTVPASVSAAPR